MSFNEKLNKFAKDYTSQHGEDGILEYIISKLPSNIPKICCEFGAWDGKYLSNTYTLWHDKGWSGLLIEADSKKVENLKKNYQNNFKISCFQSFLTSTGENSLDSLFIKNKLPLEIGILSIDIDSYDYYIWNGVEKVNPWIVVIEHNQTIPGFIDYVDPEETVFLRASAKALEKLGHKKGYKLICCTLTNSIFIKKEFFNSDFFPDFPVEGLFDYSHCKPFFMLPSTQSGLNQGLHAIYGIESGFFLRLCKFYFRIKSFILKSPYEVPSRKMLNYLKKFGISV